MRIFINDTHLLIADIRMNK